MDTIYLCLGNVWTLCVVFNVRWIDLKYTSTSVVVSISKAPLASKFPTSFPILSSGPSPRNSLIRLAADILGPRS